LAIDAEGRYSNFFKIGYTAFEFLLDFGQVYMDSGADNVHTRIVTTPQYAKALAELLIQTLTDFETKYGQIPIAPGEEMTGRSGEPS
jgi:hypothetical protein